MEEDLQHIDLIDKYLNDILSDDEQATFDKLMRKSPSFRRDLEVYQQMYMGLEVSGNSDDLKERLPDYYEEFQEDKRKEEKKGKIRQLIIWGTGIAAAIALGWFLIYQSTWEDQYPITQPNNDPPPVLKNKDSLKVEELKKVPKPKEQIVNKKVDTTANKLIPEAEKTVFALGGMVPLEKEKIQLITYPTNLMYTFNGSQLQIFGDPLIPALRIKVGKSNNGNYMVRIKDDFYPIKNSTTPKPLQKTTQQLSQGSLLEEEIEIVFKDIRQQQGKKLSSLQVFVKKENEAGILYKFEKPENNPLRLAINGNVAMENMKVWELNYKGKTNYYLQLGEKLYQLNQETSEFLQITPLNLLESDINKLFRNRSPFKKQLVLWE